jgi:hypothetical protein
MRKILFSTFLLLLATNAFSYTLPRGGAELLNPKAYAINTGLMIFQRSGGYDVDGVEHVQAEGAKYQLIDLDFSLSYGVSKNLEITGLGRFRSVTSTLNDYTSKNSGPESIGVEIKYGFDPIGKARYALGAHYRQTLYSNATYDSSLQLPPDEVILGDSGSEYGVNLYMTYLMNSSVKWDTFFGYNSPANNLSDEVVYKFEGLFRFDKLAFLAGLEGSVSLKHDPFTETPLIKPVQSTGDTLLWNSINRERMAPYIGANYAFEKVLVGIKGQTVVSGKSTDKGSSFLISLGWSSEGISPESLKVGSFKEYQVDGSVLKISARGNYIRIDQGLSTDVEKGMKFDIYQTDYFGGNVLVGSGIVYKIGADWSIIKLTKRYKDTEIKPGFAARGY